MKSMKGFGRGTASREGWEVAVQASSVNRKSLEVAFSLPREWQLLEPELAGLVRERFARGRIQVVVDLKGTKTAGMQWDEAAVDAVLERLAEIPKDKRIVTHCSTGVRAEMAYHKLKEKGYQVAFLNAEVEIGKNGSVTVTPK